MAKSTLLKPSHKAIQQYYKALDEYRGQGVKHEGALETAFSRLLADTARLQGWTLVPKEKLRVGKHTLFPDGTLHDVLFNELRRGYWEAKDTDDDLDADHSGYRTKFADNLQSEVRLRKDKTALRVNPSLTLAGIPGEALQYRLGNRSALEWVIDQYQVSEDVRSGIRSDPNRADDQEYIVRLVGPVVRVSVETVRIVNGLPGYA